MGDYIYDLMENSDLYTIAYLESFEIIEKTLNKDELQISCEANLLIAMSLNLQHAQILSDIIDQTVILNFNVQQSGGTVTKKPIGKSRMKRHQGGSGSGRNRGNTGGLRKIEKG